MKKNLTTFLHFSKTFAHSIIQIKNLSLSTLVLLCFTAALSAQTPEDTSQNNATKNAAIDTPKTAIPANQYNETGSSTWYADKVKPIIHKAENFFNPGKPWKAVVCAAVLPGMGQAYNQQIWKVPIVWGIFGAGIYFCTVTQENFTIYRDALRNRVKGLPDQFPELNNSALVSERDNFKNIRDIAFIATAAIYLLQIADAFVFAHMHSFDVSKDLTVSMRPHINYKPALRSPVVGFGLNLSF